MSAILMLCLVWDVDSHAATSIPEEPGDELLVEQLHDTIVGLLIRGYSLRGNGAVDYRTARQIMGISYDDPATGELDVAPHPIFYWYDPDQNGHWEMWVDRDGEGHLADAVRYNWKQERELNLSSDTWR
jgi:hypothetical protein